MTTEQQEHNVMSGCQGCPWNEATYLASNGANELRLCECCVQAHEADGWTITRYRISPTPTECDPEPSATRRKDAAHQAGHPTFAGVTAPPRHSRPGSDP